MSDAAAGAKNIGIKTRNVKTGKKIQTYKVLYSCRNKRTKKGKGISSHLDETSSFNTPIIHVFLKRFSYDLKMKTREQSRNNKRME